MIENNKVELLGMSEVKLQEFMAANGEKPFRGRQINQWIYKKEVSSFYDMNDLPKELRQKLDEIAVVSIPRVLKQRVSQDGTRKFLMELVDKKKVETVVIPQSRDKNTKYSLCISSQVGCPIGCSFCATGNSGYQRNLLAYEIVGQVLGSNREIVKRLKYDAARLITNIVYMGMGEPLLNYDEVIKSIHILNDPRGVNIGQRHITVSTSGEVNGINRLASENLQITLAISLHAGNNALRDELIPMNRKYPLEKLIKAVEGYISNTNRRVTFEYVMLDNVNIEKKDARDLIALLKPMLANINLIPYNEVSGLEFRKPPANKIKQFYEWLVEGGLNVTLREERGADIEAACGQLSAKRDR
ncbi:MAG: 23S rRNA (adenine(2503)-C(2))-methyltransferase RlmN [Syntrophomonas sp.]